MRLIHACANSDIYAFMFAHLYRYMKLHTNLHVAIWGERASNLEGGHLQLIDVDLYISTMGSA